MITMIMMIKNNDDNNGNDYTNDNYDKNDGNNHGNDKTMKIMIAMKMRITIVKMKIMTKVIKKLY